MLEMGEPVRIIDLARNMIRLAGYEPDADIAIEFVGAAARARSSTRSSSTATSARSRPPPSGSCAPCATRPLDPDWVEQTVDRLETLVASGDEAGLAEHVVELDGRRRRRRADTLGLIGKTSPRFV